jgi:uncharacterized protein
VITPVLLLPGWHNSGPDHWQSRWEHTHGFVRVQQHDWDRPLRGDWMMQLEEAVIQHERCVLVAHSLACVLVAAWSAHSKNTHRVQGALLAAPADVERTDIQQVLHSWSPLVHERLPFESIVAASRNDPHCSFMRASSLAHAWGARFVDCGMRAHINAEANVGDWPEGFVWLQELLNKEVTHGH